MIDNARYEQYKNTLIVFSITSHQTYDVKHTSMYDEPRMQRGYRDSLSTKQASFIHNCNTVSRTSESEGRTCGWFYIYRNAIITSLPTRNFISTLLLTPKQKTPDIDCLNLARPSNSTSPLTILIPSMAKISVTQ
jgi:hypothetical protein